MDMSNYDDRMIDEMSNRYDEDMEDNSYPYNVVDLKNKKVDEVSFDSTVNNEAFKLHDTATNNHGDNAILINNNFQNRLYKNSGAVYFWTNKKMERISDTRLDDAVKLAFKNSKQSKASVTNGTTAFVKSYALPIKHINPVSTKIFVKNGVYDLNENGSFEFKEHSPTNGNTFFYEWDYIENSEQPRDLLCFFDSSFEGDIDIDDKILAIQEFLGWALISDNLNIQKAFALRGATRSGKGTVLHALRCLYKGSDALRSLTNLSDLINNKSLNSMITANIVVDYDAKKVPGKDASEVIGVINKITANEPISIKKLWVQETVDEPINCKLAFACNALPTMIDDTGAITGRYHQIMFNQSFLGREDHALYGKVEREVELIANWAIKGLIRLMKNKRFTEPESTKIAMLEASEHSQPLTVFIDECLIFDADARTKTSALYKQYTLWCLDNGEKPTSSRNFATSLGDTLRSKGVVRKTYKSIDMADGKNKAAKGFIGISINESAVRTYMPPLQNGYAQKTY